MQLTPRYGDDPIITVDGAASAILAPTVRQRRRLADLLASFTDEQWAHPSRCAGWTNRDVIVHLDSTNAFWGFAIAMGLKGEPTEFLRTFDPVASPAQLVADSALTPAEVLERFTGSTEALAAQLASLDDDGWAATAEAPVGHVSVTTLAHHALWDSWVHERDILLPLGMAMDEEADEVLASLRYAAALSPAFAVNSGSDRHGTLLIETADLGSFAVVVGDHVAIRDRTPDRDRADLILTGDAIDLLEALSLRAPLTQDVPEGAAWMFDGLAQVFDQADPPAEP